MSAFDAFRHRLRLLLDRDGYDRELAAEREFHLSLERMQQEAAGAAPDQAAARARRRFGNLTAQSEARRSVLPFQALERIARNVRFTLRQLRRAPAFAVGVVGTFALGLGANAAMFDLLDRFFFRAPAFLAAPERTHRIYFSGGDLEQAIDQTGYRRAAELTAGTSSFTTIAVLWTSPGVQIGLGATAREAPVHAVSASYWTLFRMRPALGRFFTVAEDAPPAGRNVAVVSYDYWRTALGGRADVIGTTLQVGALPSEIVGVAPAGFHGLGAGGGPAVFVPVAAMAGEVMGREDPTAWVTRYCCGWLQMVALRKDGVSVAAATADLTRAYQRSLAEERREGGLGPATAAALPPRAEAGALFVERGPLRSRNADVVVWLGGVALIVLLIACANVANLLVARAQQRTHEFAVRAALGVSRRRLVEQLLTESLLLALLGAGAGLLVARLLRALLDQRLLGAAAGGGLDGRVILFTLVLATAAGLVAGLHPALRTAGGAIAPRLKAGPRSGGRDGARVRAALLAAQAAFSVLLLVGAALFVRSMHNVRSLPLGFDADRLIYLYPRERTVAIEPAAREAFLERLTVAARGTAGVTQASRATSIPFWNSRTPPLFRLSGDSLSAVGRFVMQAASPEYFATAGTPLLRGRGIVPADLAGSEPVVVVSDSMAHRLWPGTAAIGECVRIGAPDAPCRRVVGVAASIRRSGLTRDPGLQYYIPATQGVVGQGGVLLRVQGNDVEGAAERIRRTLEPLVPGDSYLGALPLMQAIDPLTASWRLGATVFTGFGVLALLLACGGLYSVIAYDVARRTHELGVRLALGARRGAVVRLVLRTSLRPAAIGIGAGLVAALAAAPWLRRQLFEISPYDPASLGLAVGTMLLAATLAAFLPARRAAAIDPAVSLRES